MDDTTLSPELLSAIHTMKVHEVDHLPLSQRTALQKMVIDVYLKRT